MVGLCRFGLDRVWISQDFQHQSKTLSIADWPQQLFYHWISYQALIPHQAPDRPNISNLYQIRDSSPQKKTKVSAEKPGAKEPPYPVESPSPPALPPCSARNAPASSSRPAGHTENPNVPRLALSTWSPRRGVVENIWRWATNLFMVWNGIYDEIYLGVECHIYATKLYATYMPHSYMGVGYVECICYISIDISKNWPASMVGWAPPRIVFPSGSCLPFSKCSAASY